MKTVKYLFILGMMLAPVSSSAQGLTLGSSSGGAVFTGDTLAWGLVAMRYLLALGLLLGGFSAFKNGYNWMYWEGNAAKAKNAQKGLSRSLIFITIFFFLAFLFRVFVPDYSLLGV